MSLIFNKVKKDLNGNNVLDSLSFELQKGEVCSLFSEENQELSLIASLLSLNEDPDEGKILLDGEAISEESLISVVNSNSQLFSHLSVKDNYLSYLRNKEDIDKDAAIEKVTSKLQLTEVLHKKPEDMSAGQYIRALIGKALLISPKVLVLDNFLARFDGLARTNFWKEVRIIAKTFDLSILFLSNLSSEALLSGDKLGYLKYGKLMAFDTPMNIYKNPQILDVALAFSNPPASLLKGEYSDGKIFFGDLSLDVPSFKERHDAYYENALKNMSADDVLYEPYTNALRDKHTLLVALRTEDLSFDGEGKITLIVKGNEKFGTRNLLHLSFGENEILAFSFNEVEPNREIKLSLTKEINLIFDPLTKRRI